MLDFNVQHYASLDSSNKEALRQAENGANEGLVIVAEAQTAGKGRLGRKWHTIDHALAMTVLLR
ncbi:MAG: biotin--[acetyl-CoA-carboxylase] ligase, partial [Ghiorsea sp.]